MHKLSVHCFVLHSAVTGRILPLSKFWAMMLGRLGLILDGGRAGMARPKLPIEQRRRLTMTVRIRQDLDEGFAAVALLRGTTKSGLVSQYAAEQIRVEQERERSRFEAALKEIKAQRKLQRKSKTAASRS